MADIVITSTTNSVKVVFNDVATRAGKQKAVWNKAYITDISLDVSGDFVLVRIDKGATWKVAFTNTIAMKIDSIDGVEPTDNSHLYTILEALIA